MRLLITRPRDDAETIAALLRARGHDPVVAPLMETRIHPGEKLALDGVQALLATSANGVRALAERTDRRDIPLYAVGPQTAETARLAGFVPVHSADGDATALVEIVAAQTDPGAGVLFHASGAETAGRVSQALQARGFTVQSAILYDAVAATSLPEAADSALRQGGLDGVLLFSPRSAKIFSTLVGGAQLAENCQALDAFCISAATAAALGTLAFHRVAVAGQPNQEGILALLA